MPSSVLNISHARRHLVLPTTMVISILLSRKTKLREVKKHAQGHAGDGGQSKDHLSHSGPRDWARSPPSCPRPDPDLRKDRCMDGCVHGCTDGCMDGCVHAGWTGGPSSLSMAMLMATWPGLSSRPINLN